MRPAAVLIPTMIALAIAVPGRVARASPDPFVGRWSGVRPIVAGPFHGRDVIDVEIRPGAAPGTLELVDHNPAATGFPPKPLTREGADTVGAQWQAMFGTMIFSGRLQPDGTMQARSSGNDVLSADVPGPVLLRRDDPAAQLYRVPRLDAAGKRLTSYHYAPPASPDWPVSTLDAEGIDRPTIEKMVDAILAQQAEPLVNHTDAVLILRHGRLVLEEYFWGYGRDVPHPISSDTKSLTSMIAGFAYDAGKLRLDARVSSFFPDYADTPWVKQAYPIAVGDLMSMQAGIAWNENLPYQDRGNTAVALIQTADPTLYVLSRGIADPAGAKWQYDSGLPNLFGEILRRVVGQPLDVYAADHLFAPLGITNVRWSRQRNGDILPSGGALLRPADSAKLGQLMLDGGMWRGKRLLSKAWVDLSTSPKTRPGDYAYGYYWHLADAAHRRLGGHDGFMAIGQGGQYIVVVPDLDVVVVLSSSNWEPGGTKHGLDDIIARYIIPAVRH